MNPPDDARFEAARRHFFQGLEALQRGDAAAAEPQFVAALDLVPGRPSTLLNLAATRLRLGRPAQALVHADEVLAQSPDEPDALFHRGLALARLDRHAEAADTLDRLLARAADGPLEARMQRAQSRHALGRLEAALDDYADVNRIAPQWHLAWTQRGGLLRELGRAAEAAHCFEQAIAHGAPADLHRYYLASVGGGAAPARAPSHYVGALFDGYAESFDRHLVEVLRYAAPERLVQRLAALGRGPFASALDLGCGTGLVGPLLRRQCARLVGVDLSAGMLDRARERGSYDALLQAEMAEHLATTDETHDLVIAADAFIYVGDLAPVFAGAARVLRPGGSFAFSAERAAPGAGDYELRPSLRYAHAEATLRRLAGAHRFALLSLEHGPIREDQGRPVDGLYLVLGRGA